jgi:splicing factor 45
LEKERKKKEQEEAAFLIEQKPMVKRPIVELEYYTKPMIPAPSSEEKTQEEKILGMLEKTGWKMGQGLGKHGQGMTTPLIAKKTAANTAVIVNSTMDMSAVLPADVILRKQIEQFYNMPPTRVLLLENMVGPAEVDDALRDEVIEECQIYGPVLNCEIRVINGAPEDQAVRMLVEYDRKDAAIHAFGNLYGRYFGGRQVVAKFYDEGDFAAGRFEVNM